MAFSRVVSAAFVLAVGAGCGSGSSQPTYDQSHSASQIAADSIHALKVTPSAHVEFQGSSQGSPVTANLDLVGSNLKGTITADGVPYQVIAVNDETYVYGPDLAALARLADAQVADEISSKVGDRWALMPPSAPVSVDSLGALANLSTLADCLPSGVGLVKKGTMTISADRVVELADASGTRVFVDLKAPHYPRRVEFGPNAQCEGTPVGAGNAGSVELTQIGSPFTITAPANYVDLASLGITLG